MKRKNSELLDQGTLRKPHLERATKYSLSTKSLLKLTLKDEKESVMESEVMNSVLVLCMCSEIEKERVFCLRTLKWRNRVRLGK